MDRFIYVDNAATTRIYPEVLDKMMPFLTEQYGNPSSLYSFGQNARQAIDEARDTVAKYLNCRSDEVFFTSGGSESDNWAIRMTAKLLEKKGKKHIISTVIEHHAVLHTLKALEKQGFEVTLLPVNKNGIVCPEDLRNAIRQDTALVTIMFANNEIGTIQPIAEIGKICREKGVWLHTDAVQAVGHIPVDFAGMNIDLLSMSAHKFHGPKGVGALIVRKGLRFPSLIEGGSQEKGRRAGTENTAGIVGLAEALKLSCEGMDKTIPALTAKRDRLIAGLLNTVERSRLNGDPVNRLPGNANISFEGIEGESLLLLLDFKGVCASSGSACTSGSLDPSHVLLALGLSHAIAHGSLRISLSDDNTDEDIDALLEIIPPIIQQLRSMSPVWEKIVKGEKYE
jgi:cysteine desulfurase